MATKAADPKPLAIGNKSLVSIDTTHLLFTGDDLSIGSLRVFVGRVIDAHSVEGMAPPCPTSLESVHEDKSTGAIHFVARRAGDARVIHLRVVDRR